MNLEIAYGATNARRLERALRNSDFVPDANTVWRWRADGAASSTIVKFELLADLDDVPAEAVIEFSGSDELGAVNLRGTGFAARSFDVHRITARVGGVVREVEVNVADLAGFLLAKVAAAHARRKPKDWYDIAFVLLHNNEGSPRVAAVRVIEQLGGAPRGAVQTSVDDLLANFQTPTAQGSRAYALQMTVDHPEVSVPEAAADAVAAVHEFHLRLFQSMRHVAAHSAPSTGPR